MLIPIGLNDRRALPALLSPPSSVRTKRAACTEQASRVRVRLAVKSCAEVTVQLRCDVVALPQKAPRLALTHQTASTGPHQGLHKRTRCRECAGCLRANCGACVSCRDMLKFGGSGKKAKACMQRVCLKLHRQHQLSFASSQGPSGSADGRHVSSTVLADESDNSACHGATAEASAPSIAGCSPSVTYRLQHEAELQSPPMFLSTPRQPTPSAAAAAGNARLTRNGSYTLSNTVVGLASPTPRPSPCSPP